MLDFFSFSPFPRGTVEQEQKEIREIKKGTQDRTRYIHNVPICDLQTRDQALTSLPQHES